MFNSEVLGTPYGNLNNLPKLRFPSQDSGAFLLDPPHNRIVSPTVTKKKGNSGLFSFLSSSTEPELSADLSTSHTTDPYNDDKSSLLYNIIPHNRRFVLSDNLKFILNCCMWYMSSSLTNNIGKTILLSFSFPVTLTIVQFFLVAFWCYIVSIVFKTTRIRVLNSTIIKTIAPLAVFLIVGHVFSSIAINEIPVSLVHTIKALAPLFTVMFYRFIFQVQYTNRVYVSLLPLTIGVILACSFTYSNNFIGLSFALGSCFVFVTQNIFSKKLLFKESKLGDRNPNKLDKLNVLFFSSSLSCLMMIPLWLYSDSSGLVTYQQEEMSATKLIFYLFMNGTMNFSQNWFAFTTLSLTSPVTYSILSLLKRIFVIVMSILWFGQTISGVQSLGILLTFVGLWMYQKAKSDVDKGETKLVEKSMHLLPIQQQSESPSPLLANDIKNL